MTDKIELYDKNIKCSLCKKEFTTKKVRMSRLRIVKKDEDLLNYYNLEHPMKYNIIVCPNCGYSSSESKFNNINEEQKQIIEKNISSRWTKRDFGGVRSLEMAIDSYKLALLNLSLIEDNDMDLGILCLNIGWLYRLLENKKEEKRFLKLAKDKLILAYDTGKTLSKKIGELKIIYLIGELSRRTGDKNGALFWFNICLNHHEINLNPRLNQMTREQWKIAKEMKE